MSREKARELPAEVAPAFREAWRGFSRSGGSYASEMRAMLSVQVSLILHYLGGMDDECAARATRTLYWINEQMSVFPATHYADEALRTD